MSNLQHTNSHGEGGYEHRDIGIRGVLYFLAGLIVAGIIVHFVVNGLFSQLTKRFEERQQAISPLVRNVPSNTRRIPPQYNENYQQYLKHDFPAPQLETDETTELNDVRLREEQTLSSYDWVDQKAGTVRIPIDRAIDLLAQRGLPVRSGNSPQPALNAEKPQPQKKKGKKQ